MSTYNKSISQRSEQYNYGDADSAPTSHYNRDDEYSRRAASLSYECQSLVNDVLVDKARSSRLYQTDLNDQGMLESDVTATHMRPSEVDQQYTGMGQPSTMDLIDGGREVANYDFEDISDLNEMEEPESSRNGTIQDDVETRSRFSTGRERACTKKVIYKDVGGIIVPTEVNMNKACIDERFGNGRERAVSLRLKVPTLSGPTERLAQRERMVSDLVFETKRENMDDTWGRKNYEFETVRPASLEADSTQGRITGDLSKGSYVEDELDREMMNGVMERAGVMTAINQADKTFELDRMRGSNFKPSERFNASYYRSRARGNATGASRFTSSGEAMGNCDCAQPGCPQCDRFYSTGGTSQEYRGPARFSVSGEAFGGYN